jgi:hypothetical protein
VSTGPISTAPRVDFDDLMTRLNRYKKEEREAVQTLVRELPDDARARSRRARRAGGPRRAPGRASPSRLDPFDDALGG